MVELEIKSTFAFQGARWLGDTLRPFLTATTLGSLGQAKVRAEKREAAEAEIPEHLLYEKGWPTCVPTFAEATLLAYVRAKVADAVGLPKTFTNSDEIIARYQELLRLKEEKLAKKR